METQLALSKTSSFSVKDLLDLPDAKDLVASAGEAHAALGLGDLSDVTATSHGYYDNDNPYARWLQSNEGLQYSSK